MASLKAFPPMVSFSAMRFKRIPSLPLPSPLCHYIPRNFTSGNSIKTFSKRKIQTSTGWQPHAFSQEPPPTLVPGVSKIATTGITARCNDLKPSVQIDQYQVNPDMLRTERSSTSSTDKRETEQLHLANIPAPPEAKPRSKLRARKAAIRLTPGAVNQLRKLLNQPSPKLIKIGVRNRGCSGLAYHLEYVDKAGLLDEEIEQDGVKVVIDSKALFSIIGSEMDWIEDKLHQKFVFNNPNIKEQCGCGESFMV